MAKVKLILSIYVLVLALVLIYGGLMAEGRKLNMEKKESSSTVEKMTNPVGSLHWASDINTAGGSKTDARPSAEAAAARRSSAGVDQLVTESGLDVQSTTPGHSPGVGHSIGPASNEPNP